MFKKILMNSESTSEFLSLFLIRFHSQNRTSRLKKIGIRMDGEREDIFLTRPAVFIIYNITYYYCV